MPWFRETSQCPSFVRSMHAERAWRRDSSFVHKASQEQQSFLCFFFNTFPQVLCFVRYVLPRVIAIDLDTLVRSEVGSHRVHISLKGL